MIPATTLPHDVMHRVELHNTAGLQAIIGSTHKV